MGEGLRGIACGGGAERYCMWGGAERYCMWGEELRGSCMLFMLPYVRGM